jgi:hypothetical protein
MVPLVFVMIGFAFLIFEFRWRAILIGLVYCPLMMFLLITFSLMIVGTVFHDFL